MSKPISLHRGLTRSITLAAAAALLSGAPLSARAQDTIRYGAATTSVLVAPFLLTIVQPEIYAKYGIKLQPTYFQGKSSNCVAALIANAVDVCSVGTTTGTDAIAEGAKLKAITSFAGPINEIILSARTVKKLGISPNAPVRDRLRAMDGLRIISAAPGSAHYTTLDMMLKEVGLSIKSLKYQTLGDPIAMMEAIRNDQVDGALWSAGSLGGLIADGGGVRWISIPRGDVPSQISLPYNTVFANTAWVDANPDLVRRFQAAHSDSVKLLKADHKGTSDKIKAAFFPELDQAIWQDGFDQTLPVLFDGGKIKRGGWELWLKLQSDSTGKDYAPAAYDKVVDKGAQAD